MSTDIVDLRDFYQTPLGLMAQRLLRAHIHEMWPDIQGKRVLSLGFGGPLLFTLMRPEDAVYVFMPATQGACYWPQQGPNISCLVEPDKLPLPDNSVDRVIALHTLEGLADPDPVLGEIWRVMKSGGRFLAIVPNRRGLWAHSDRTPFGNGQPYSSSQIRKALHSQGLLVERVRHALYAPPNASWISRSLADKTEIIASRLFPGFGGVLLVESSKQLYAPISVRQQARHRLIFPLLLPTARPLPT